LKRELRFSSLVDYSFSETMKWFGLNIKMALFDSVSTKLVKIPLTLRRFHFCKQQQKEFISIKTIWIFQLKKWGILFTYDLLRKGDILVLKIFLHFEILGCDFNLLVLLLFYFLSCLKPLESILKQSNNFRWHFSV